MIVMHKDDATRVVKMLTERGWHIAFAESCTAGLCAARLVDVPDASRVLDVSFVTYAESAKTEYLAVPPEMIGQYGVVSEEVAAAMASGCAARAGCEVAVGVTGYAGPSGGTPEAPVGTVCFGFSIGGAVTTVTRRFGAIGRAEVRAAAVDFVFAWLRDALDGLPQGI